MKLEEIKFPQRVAGPAVTYSKYWKWTYVQGIRVQVALSPECHGNGRNYEVGHYVIEAPDGRRWTHLDPIAAQAVLYHLLSVTSEGNR